MTYNYYNAVLEDVRNYINNEVNFTNYEDIDELKEDLNECLWIDDSVTGNGSGSYTFSTYEAEENLSHNFDILEEVADAFGIEPTICAGWEHGAEWWDVTIRCYYLPQAIDEAVDEIEDDFNKAHEETDPDHVSNFQLYGFLNADALEEANKWNAYEQTATDEE